MERNSRGNNQGRVNWRNPVEWNDIMNELSSLTMVDNTFYAAGILSTLPLIIIAHNADNLHIANSKLVCSFRASLYRQNDRSIVGFISNCEVDEYKSNNMKSLVTVVQAQSATLMSLDTIIPSCQLCPWGLNVTIHQ